MHRFYLEPDCFSELEVVWKEKESRHICRVLRLQAGERVLAFDGMGMEFEVKLEEVSPERVRGVILQSRPVDREIPVSVELVQGIAKSDKMDWIVQKNVEVGVSAIRPIMTQYTVVKLEEKKRESRLLRWESVAREACKQCRRNQLPVIYAVEDWAQFLMGLDPGRVYLLCYEAGQDEPSFKEILQQEKERIFSAGVSIVIGPEGGWSEKEVEEARSRGMHIVGLGPRILRTETAGLVAASAILYEMGALE